MPALTPEALLSTADHLLITKGGRPSEANLRRATSTTYYALFHCLAKCGADLLIGGGRAARSQSAWRQVYRALEHSSTNKCGKNNETLKKFPDDVIDFANKFRSMKIKRENADYDPTEKFFKSSVMLDIAEARDVIDRFNSSPRKDRCAFAAFMLFKLHPKESP